MQIKKQVKPENDSEGIPFFGVRRGDIQAP